jgi:hypothetical protein
MFTMWRVPWFIILTDFGRKAVRRVALLKKNHEKAALFLILLVTAFLAVYKIW